MVLTPVAPTVHNWMETRGLSEPKSTPSTMVMISVSRIDLDCANDGVNGVEKTAGSSVSVASLGSGRHDRVAL